MVVISDTSPLTNLIQIGQLDILEQMFGRIIIPYKVFEELSVYEGQLKEIEKRDWIIIREVINQEEVRLLEHHLDSGEAEAIIFAKEIHADFLIVDERKGRRIAEEYGLKIIGLLGTLIQAKKKGILPELKPILDKLINEIGFRVSKKLYDRILEEVKE
jgi:uncharacterized protein